MQDHRKHWWLLAGVLVVTFTLLGFFGREVYRQAPPIPDRVVTESGQTVMTQDDILAGQQVWQSTGGQQLGSIWGHGAYQAPDWSADWLHRESINLLEIWAVRDHGISYGKLPEEARAALGARLKSEMRTNTYDSSTGTLTVSQTAAIDRCWTVYGTGMPRHVLQKPWVAQDVTVKCGPKSRYRP